MCYVKKKHPDCCGLTESEMLWFWCVALTFLYKNLHGFKCGTLHPLT